MYTLMRINIFSAGKTLVLDLYDLKNNKGIELHYSLYHKTLDTSLKDILDELTYKVMDLNSWDNLVQQFIERK